MFDCNQRRTYLWVGKDIQIARMTKFAENKRDGSAKGLSRMICLALSIALFVTFNVHLMPENSVVFAGSNQIVETSEDGSHSQNPLYSLLPDCPSTAQCHVMALNPESGVVTPASIGSVRLPYPQHVPDGAAAPATPPPKFA